MRRCSRPAVERVIRAPAIAAPDSSTTIPLTLASKRPFPDAANPTSTHLDNDAQTVFAANFIAQSNSLGQQANNLVGTGDADAINALINDLHSFQKTVTNFDAAQGGIFEARFDNELLGDTSTLGAEVSKMIEGLQTGNAALVAAAADQMHANSADVGGNNTPATGGTYNADGLTVAEVLSTATPGPLPAIAAVAPAAAPAAVTAATTAPAGTADADPSHTAEDFGAGGHHHVALNHHLEHVWG